MLVNKQGCFSYYPKEGKLKNTTYRNLGMSGFRRLLKCPNGDFYISRYHADLYHADGTLANVRPVRMNTLPHDFFVNDEIEGIFLKDDSYYGTKYNPVPPAWRDSLAHTLYHEGIFIGYRGMEKFNATPLFPFGFGLTYSSFEYSDFKVEPCYGGFNVNFTLKNTGKVAAAEVAQVYVSAVAPTLPRAGRELKGFRKVLLQPGESQQVSIFLDRDSFAYYDTGKHDFFVESGDYRISVAADVLAEKAEYIVNIR
jgi:beta-glucosidase